MTLDAPLAAFAPVTAELGMELLRQERDVVSFQRPDGWKLMISARYEVAPSVVISAPPAPDGTFKTYQLWILRQALLGECMLPDPVTFEAMAEFLRANAEAIFDPREGYRDRYLATNAAINALAEELRAQQ